MKIGPLGGALRKSEGSGKKSPSSPADFSRIANTAQAEETLLDEIFAQPDKVLENIFLLAEEVDRAGEQLAEKPTPENFLNYKKYVGLVVKGALRNMKIEDKIVSRLRRQAVYKTAQEIDTVLADLARRILNDEKNRVDILQLTGHLKGLIVNLLA